MENQDQPSSPPPGGEAETGIAPVVPGLARTTRPLPSLQERRVGATVANSAQRERIAMLINALSEPDHPLHQSAAEDLVALGDAAVPALNEALRPTRPWLTSYRAAEALGQIGDGRAAGPLMEALRHPNSNVRWSAIRALASVGDARAILELRRVAREDRSKTSWGEPVAGAAQSALDQMQSRNLLMRGADLIKTAVACVLMLVSLIVAYSVVTSLRAELDTVGRLPEGSSAPVAIVSTALPTETPEPTPEPLPTLPAAAAEVTATVTLESGATTLAGAVITSGNVRAQPARGDNVIGAVSEGDEVIFVAASPDGEWFRVRLGQRAAAGSRISSDDGTGWVARSLLTEPPLDIPIEPVSEPAPPADTAEPTPTPSP
jgi:hypothetical protein